MDEILFILNRFLYNDVSKHIMDYLVIKCCNCEKKFFEEESSELYNCKYACKLCIKRDRYNMCMQCQLFYGIDKSDCCVICERDTCYLYRYCPICKIQQLLDRFNGASHILLFRELVG